MLTDEEVVDTVRDLWARHRNELADHDRVYNYVNGRFGVPEVPEGASDELKQIARESVKNVLKRVRDAYVHPLTVNGFRAAESAENDAAVWALWQEQKLDARQAEAHRSAVTYGTGFAIIEESGIRLRSPRQVFAVYADPHVDDWPVYALETWVDRSGKKPMRRGRLFDETHVYPITLGNVTEHQLRAEETESTQRRFTIAVDSDEEPSPHGAEQAPVARFVNDRDAESLVVGEVEPLIPKQRAINSVNFDRLVVSRYGAFPQKYVIGWAPATESELVKASVQRLMAFDDDTVKAGAFPAAQVEPYNAILAEMLVDVAMDAMVPPFGLTGSYANLAADALAVIRAPYETKLRSKRASFGETWEQVLTVYAAMKGVSVPADAEVVWDSGEARSYAQVIDGISKLVPAGVPIEALLDDVPGWSQQRITAAQAAIRREAGRSVLDALREPTPE